jgi:transposase InsO family protein
LHRIPLRIARNAVTQLTYSDCADVAAALAKYDIDNQKIHDLLMMALSNCQEGRNVLAAYVYNPDLADKANPAAHADDGRGAYLQLEKNANGGSGTTTATLYMRQLFDIDKSLSIKDKVLAHADAYRRLLLCDEPARTLDALMKGHLLYLLQNDPHYPNYVVVEHECSKPGVSYDDAANMITALNHRLEATSPTAPDQGTALVGRTSRKLTDEQKKKAKCHNCGQIGHIRPDCPTKPSKSPVKSDQARVAAAEKKMNGSKSKTSKLQPSSDSEGDDSDYDAIGFSAVHSSSSFRGNNMLLNLFCFFLSLLPSFLFYGGLTSVAMSSWFIMDPSFDHAALEPLAYLNVSILGFILLLLYLQIDCSYVLPFRWTAKAFRSTHSIRVGWIVDSGCTKHVVNDRSALSDFEVIDARLTIGDGKHLAVTGRGTLRLEAYDDSKKAHSIVIKHVWFCPDLEVPLFSMRCWRKQGNGAVFGDSQNRDFLRQGTTQFPMDPRGDEYVWNVTMRIPDDALPSARVALAVRPPVSVATPRVIPTAHSTWHKRLGHMSIKTILHAAAHQSVRGLALVENSDMTSPVPCDSCVQTQLKVTPRRASEALRSNHPLQLVHVDGTFISQILSFGCLFGYTFTDDYSRTRAFLGVRRKSDFLKALQRYNQLYAQKAGYTLKTIIISCVQTDGGREIVDGATRRWCEENQIAIQVSAPGMSQENGIAEKSNDLLKKTARAIHKSAHFPPNFWLFSMNLAAHVLMFSMPKLFGGQQTCYERMFGHKPDISHLRVPGCLVWYYNHQVKKLNFHQDRALKGVLVGYSHRMRAYVIYGLDTKQIVHSSEVVFNETVLPFALSSSLRPLAALSPPPMLLTPVDSVVPDHLQWGQSDGDPAHMITPGPTVSSKPRELLADALTQKVLSPQDDADFDLGLDDVDDVVADVAAKKSTAPAQPAQVLPASRGVPASAFMAIALRALADYTPSAPDLFAIARSAVGFYGDEPATYHEATTGPDASQWHDAMQAEMDAMERLEAFQKVPVRSVPEGEKVLPSRWVYKIKPDKYKARICVRGDKQPLSQAGDTFSPTMKFITVRLLFALAALYSFTVWQMDVCNAFVNAKLKTAVYMQSPQGFYTPGYCLLLLKALYGLKGSPRAWFQHLQTFLIQIGLTPCELDPCLFVLIIKNSIILLVGVHVDDLLIVGIQEKTDWFRQKMKDEFKMTDLGRPEVILGLNIKYNLADGTILLNAETYISKLAKRFNFEHCQNKKSFSTPMETGCRLSIADEAKDEHEIGDFPYSSLVASLLYIAVAVRPDIAFAVKELCRFLVRPGTAMVKAAKRVLRYVIYTPTLGLLYHHTTRSILGGLWQCTDNNPIVSFSDADFAGQIDDRKSTSGMILLFNGTAISWWSRTIRTVACSTQDAEYMALSDTARETMFCRNLLGLLGFTLDTTPVFGDNNGSLALAANPGGEHQRSKHIDVRYHYIRQRVELKELVTLKVGTKHQLADFLTKALSEATFVLLVLIAMGYNTGDE